MCQYIPTRNVVRTEVTERIQQFLLKPILETEDHHKHGFLIESGIENPQKLPEKTWTFSFCPEKKIKMNKFSE